MSALSLVRIKNVPKIDDIIPIPAIANGSMALGAETSNITPAANAKEIVAIMEPA